MAPSVNAAIKYNLLPFLLRIVSGVLLMGFIILDRMHYGNCVTPVLPERANYVAMVVDSVNVTSHN